jgi:uncharacterized membrane protein
MNVKLQLILSAITACAGQILYKKGVSGGSFKLASSEPLVLIKSMISLVFSPYIFLGCVLYVASTLLWLAALSKTQLSQAYPYTALTFVLVMLASHFIFAEAVTLNRLAGYILICLGIFVISIK